MNRRPASFQRALLAAVCGGALALDAIAAETAKPSANSGASSLQEAAREFEAIRAERQGQIQPSNSVPRVALPEFHGPAVAPTSQTRQRPVAPEKQSKNWLVDAMKKSGEARANSRDKPTDRFERALENEERLVNVQKGPQGQNGEIRIEPAELESAREPKRDREDPAPRETPAPNPLAPFLRDWMSPQDHALLRPGLDPTGISSVGGASASIGGELARSGHDVAIGGEIGRERQPSSAPSWIAAAPRENPFLQTLAKPEGISSITPPPAVHSVMPAATLLPPGGASAAPRALPPPPPPSSPAKIPEFARPGTDEKYFKQLKRF